MSLEYWMTLAISLLTTHNAQFKLQECFWYWERAISIPKSNQTQCKKNGRKYRDTEKFSLSADSAEQVVAAVDRSMKWLLMDYTEMKFRNNFVMFTFSKFQIFAHRIKQTVFEIFISFYARNFSDWF